MDPADIGTRYDEPADISSIAAGQPATLFALLKALVLLLAAVMDDKQ